MGAKPPALKPSSNPTTAVVRHIVDLSQSPPAITSAPEINHTRVVALAKGEPE